MDSFDVKILACLQEDSRASFQEIGARVGLSMSACHKRSRALEERGVIQRYVAILSEEKVGLPTSVFVSVELKDQAEATLHDFEKAVIKSDQVLECNLMSGDSDYLLRVLCNGVEGYEAFHRSFLTKLPGVKRLQSRFGLRTVCRRNQIPVSAGLAPY
ncbi:Lrp/AsnC family transcriptional regulator [Hirschia baltica]|uniref:Transcriptional regulator, AsnC family n=1 Tax=Hirschia baltica (strain ATCC 49814 / DSM 5838 / IFAM 1418) TaxID=582402 RepID=C6XP17_HIRBI|nr:Lrp/AsnC family transcriptional regulator [Hirschia baltica]ACT60197.1 transcriptional regulator, AsnC family [Hirschia baltica ATCC 49814]